MTSLWTVNDKSSPLLVSRLLAAVWLITVVTFSQLPGVSSHKEAQLVQTIMNNYDYRVRPPTMNDEPVQDESEELLIMLGYIEISWEDSRLSCNVSEYSEQEYVVMPALQVWRPDIDIKNSFDGIYAKGVLDAKQYRVMIYANGSVNYWTSGTTTTLCRLDLTYFPFDRQACYVELESWTYTNSQVNLSSRSNTPDVSMFRSHEQWYLYDAGVEKIHLEVYNDHYTQFRYVFYIRRKPLYFVMTLIVPCILLSSLSLLVFPLPAEAEEKIALSITILLSFSVFQLSISSIMPKTSDYVPIITIFLTCIMMLCGTSIVCSTLVLCLRHNDPSRRAPALLRRFLLHHVARLLLMTYEDKRYPTDPRIASELTHVEQTPQSKKSDSAPKEIRRLDCTGVSSHPSATTPPVSSPGRPSKTDAGHRSIEYAVDPVLSPSSAWHNARHRSIEYAVDPVLSPSSAWNNAGHQNAIIAGEGQEDTYIYKFQDNNNDEVNDVTATDGGLVATPSDDSHTAFDNLLEWHSMGRVLDRLFFVIFLTATIIVISTLVFIYAFCAPTIVELTPIT